MSDLRMPDLNTVTIAGRLTYEPELKYTAGGKAYCRFSIANTRHYKGSDGDRKEDTAFVNGILWGPPAEWLSQKVGKGRPVIVEGRLQSNEWEKDGVKHKEVSINANRVTPLDWDNEGDNRQKPTQSTAQQTQHNAQEVEDDLPF